MNKYLIATVVATSCLIQGAFTQTSQTGFPPFETFANSDIDTINVGNLNVHIEIPIFGKAGRGLPIDSRMKFDNLRWFALPQPTCCGNRYIWEPASNIGWREIASNRSGWVDYVYGQAPPQACTNHNIMIWRHGYVYHAADGTDHHFPDTNYAVESDCNQLSHPFAAPVVANDSSGLSLFVDSNMAVSITTVGGTLLHPSQMVNNYYAGPPYGNGSNPFLPGLITDSNGNQIATDFKDTLGTYPLQFTTVSSTTSTIQYPSPTIPGSYVTATLTWAPFTLKTNFQCFNVLEYGPATSYLLTSITLPDTSQYSFTYEQTPGFPGDYTGRLSSVHLSSGGTITYSYPGANDGSICANASTANLTRTTPDGQWTYTRSVTETPWGAYSPASITSSSTTMTDPLGNQKVFTFLGDSYETKRQVYGNNNGTLSLLETDETSYVFGLSPGIVLQRTVKKELPDLSGLVAETDTHYDTSGALLTDVYNYDYGPGQVGSLINHTATSYASLTANIQYDGVNSYSVPISNRPHQVTVYDGPTGSIMAQTTYGYDETAVDPSSGTPNHMPVTGNRGNPTTVTSLVQGTTTVSSTKTYFDTGMVHVATDPLQNTLTYSYSDQGGCSKAFFTKITVKLNFFRYMTWDCNGGLRASETDENSQATSYIYGDPNFWRLTQINLPDGGQKTATYNMVSTPWNIVGGTKLSSSQTISTKTVFDSLGRVSQQQTTSDPAGTTYVDTTYDAAGHVGTVSNPYRSTSDSTYGLTTYQYDGLGRTTKVIPPDGTSTTNNVSTVYTSNCATVTDQGGKARKSCSDGLGRLTQVFEDPSGLNYETDYQYNALGSLTRVDQKGTSPTDSTQWRTRTFAYDLLSRLTSSTNPESGNITYSYDANGNVTSKTTPTATISYCYDALNRMTGKAYSAQSCPLTSPVATYTYGTTWSGSNYGIGRRVGMTDASGSSSWTYDKMGRIWSETHTIGTATKTISNLYNLDGSIQQTTYPTGSGSVIAYTYDNAGHLTLVKDTAHTITYMSATSVNPPAYIAPGQLALATFGSVKETSIFNKRLQPCWFYATTGTQLAPTTLCSGTATAANVLDLKYNFGLGTNDNGNVQSFTNNKDSNRSVSFTYDTLNRIASAITPNTDCSLVPGTALTKNWGESFTIDAWSNLKGKTTTKCTAEPLSVTPLASNRFSNFGYDAAGNMTSNGGATYTYNAEGKLVTAAGVTYTYDGDGNRVKKSNGTEYWGAGPLLESDLSGNLQREFIFAGGKRIARRGISGGAAYFYFTDHLGSSNVVTNAAGVIQNESDYYPYGGERVYAQTLASQNYKFTGKERDSESGLDNFGARYFASSIGRFMGPDAKLMTSRHLAFPQKWNKYAYVQNNPLLRFDPDGLDDYIVFRYAIDTRPGPNNGKDMMAGTDAKQWAAVKNKIESTKDAKGRTNAFHMMEGSEGPNAASVANWNKATSTPDAHVTFVGHTGFDDLGNKGILLTDGMSFGQNGSKTANVDPGSPFLWTNSEANPVSASSISLFSCNSYDLGNAYPDTDFTGVQGNLDLSTLEAAALGATDAGGGEPGADAANAAIENSLILNDTGANVENDPR